MVETQERRVRAFALLLAIVVAVVSVVVTTYFALVDFGVFSQAES